MYKFEELKEEVQHEVLKREIDHELDYYCNNFLEEDMENEATELLAYKFVGAYDIETYYSLSYNQGDGAQVNFKISLKDLNEKYNIFSKNDLKKIEEYFNLTDFILEVKQEGRYYHEYAFKIDCLNDLDGYFYDELEKYQAKYEQLLELFKQDIIAINGELSKYGYKRIEWYYTDNQDCVECIMEGLKDSWFTEGGELYE